MAVLIKTEFKITTVFKQVFDGCIIAKNFTFVIFMFKREEKGKKGGEGKGKGSCCM